MTWEQVAPSISHNPHTLPKGAILAKAPGERHETVLTSEGPKEPRLRIECDLDLPDVIVPRLKLLEEPLIVRDRLAFDVVAQSRAHVCPVVTLTLRVLMQAAVNVGRYVESALFTFVLVEGRQESPEDFRILAFTQNRFN